jgi:hypothetical protein
MISIHCAVYADVGVTARTISISITEEAYDQMLNPIRALPPGVTVAPLDEIANFCASGGFRLFWEASTTPLQPDILSVPLTLVGMPVGRQFFVGANLGDAAASCVVQLVVKYVQ